MNIALLNNAIKVVKRNGPEILTAAAASGVVSTGVLAWRAGKNVSNPKYNITYVGKDVSRKQFWIDHVKLTWKEYVPPVASGLVTIGCIVASHKMGGRRTAAAIAAYSATELAFTEYKEKAKELVGANKEQAIRDGVAQDRVTNNPPSKAVVILGGGDVLCLDMRSQQYFRSNHDLIKRAENEINFQINHENYVSLSEFYIMLGLPITHESVHNGWTFERLMETDISTALTDDNQPCLTVSFNYCKPLHDIPGAPYRSDQVLPPCEVAMAELEEE